MYENDLHEGFKSISLCYQEGSALGGFPLFFFNSSLCLQVNPTPSQPDHLTPSQPDHLIHSQPDHLTPSQPDHLTPSQPDHLTLSQPDHLTPSQPDHLTPSQPGHQGLATSKSNFDYEQTVSGNINLGMPLLVME